MTATDDKLIFRLQHLLPQGLSSAAPKTRTSNFCEKEKLLNNSKVLPNVPEEVEFPMSFGKIAGTVILQ